MMSTLLDEKFAKIGVDNAPGQEGRQQESVLPLQGETLEGTAVDFSHGDVDAFAPIPGSIELFNAGYAIGGKQAYTEYRGQKSIRDDLADKLSNFWGKVVNGDKELIITPGTQGALFLAMGATIGRGDKVAIVEPDYFANRKLVEFFDGEMVPIHMDYLKGESQAQAGLDLKELEAAFADGVKVFLFSNPNNPTGVIYAKAEIEKIASLAKKYEVTIIADELYSRQVFDGRDYFHFCQATEAPDKVITIIGPSKTESLSGFRLGIAYGAESLIERMEKLQAIVSLRAPGYSQAVLKNWFAEPQGWLAERVNEHQNIRDSLIKILEQVPGIKIRKTEAGSYLFIKLPSMKISIGEFVKILRIQAAATVTPGTEFGPQFTDSFRINFSQDLQAARAAMERTVIIINRYKK